MLINLSDVLSNDGKTLQTKVKLDMTSFESRMGSFTISDSSEVAVDIVNLGKKRLSIDVSCNLTVDIPCDRCLKIVKNDFCITSHKDIDMNKTEDDRLNELDENDYIVGNDLDVDGIIYDEILVNWPVKILCKEDCKGICKKCGANLNKGDCGCDQVVLDPRMAAIRDIFNNSKQ